MSRPMILVTGATGQQGGATIRELLRRGWQVRALVRDLQAPKAATLSMLGATRVRGDLDDASSLRAALVGVHGVLSVQSPMKIGPGGEARQGMLLASLAAESGVRHFIQCSAGGVDRHTGVPHFESKRAIERHVSELGLRATILRPAAFMENFSSLLFRTTMLSMMKTYLAPTQKMQLVSVRDVGWFAAEAFEKPDRFVGRAVELAGDCVSLRDAVTTLRKSRLRPALSLTIPHGLRARLPEDFRLMFEWIAREGFRADIEGLRREHSGLLTLQSWARK